MFGLSSLAVQLFQGSAQRTWNCVTQITNLLWYKFNHLRDPIMPRSRRRHHSRSKSRSRSHSHDRDREAKRRKVENVESPHKSSVSEEESEEISSTNNSQEEVIDSVEETKTEESDSNQNEEMSSTNNSQTEESDKSQIEDMPSTSNSQTEESNEEPVKIEPVKQLLEDKLKITPKKISSPKQLQKKLESEKKRKQKQLEKEERERKRQEEKEQLRLEKEKLKQEKEEQLKKKNEQKAKEREQKEEVKRKEKEEKEAKRKEREEKEEAKKKERELDKQRKQQEIDEKNKEKQKIEEQKQKAAAAFVNFFVSKKPEAKVEEEKISTFMPFQVKSDMRLPPLRRVGMTEDEKDFLVKFLEQPDEKMSFLTDLKNGKKVRKCGKTWPFEEDVVLIEEDFGTSICEDKPKLMKMRAKFLKFHENKRPAYCGTWRKTSKIIKPRRPVCKDKNLFDYDVDSDDDWEEEEQGESLNGSDDEEKEAEAEDEYEVDNEFFVPHGHLSDDEIDDEASAKLSPESHKQKLKLLKDEFDHDMQAKTNRMKPRSIGCIWYNKDRSNVDEAIDRHLRPFCIITNGQIIIRKRNDIVANISAKKQAKELPADLIPAFLKLIHGNVNKKAIVVEEFITYMQNNGFAAEVTKTRLGKKLKEFAQWKKCLDQGPMFNKFCWCLENDIKKKYNIA